MNWFFLGIVRRQKAHLFENELNPNPNDFKETPLPYVLKYFRYRIF